MNKYEFMSKHPFLTFFLAELVVVNSCKLVNNIVAYKTGTIRVPAEDVEDSAEDPAEEMMETE